MSGTASANVFSSDPGKKFDVIFSIDMKQLLTSLGAKPEQIAQYHGDGGSEPEEADRAVVRIDAGDDGHAGRRAGRNAAGMQRRNAPQTLRDAMGGGGQQMIIMGAPGGQAGDQAAAQGGGRAGGGGMRGGFGGQNMTDEQRTENARGHAEGLTGGKNIQDLTPKSGRKSSRRCARVMEKQGGAAGAAERHQGRRRQEGPRHTRWRGEGRRRDRGGESAAAPEAAACAAVLAAARS